MLKHAAPSAVPQLIDGVVDRSPVAGRTKAASPETKNRIDPSWLTVTIHQPSEPGSNRNRPWQISMIADVAGHQEQHAADHFRRPDQPIFCCPAVEIRQKDASRLMANAIVPQNNTKADTQPGRIGS